MTQTCNARAARFQPTTRDEIRMTEQENKGGTELSSMHPADADVGPLCAFYDTTQDLLEGRARLAYIESPFPV
jgi:hypothetical protein